MIHKRPLSPTLQKTINDNAVIAAMVLASSQTQNNQLNGLKKGLGGLGKIIDEKHTNTFEQSIEQYNKGITEDEIRAWVWYKSNLPLNKGGELFENGWAKYKTLDTEKEITAFVKKGLLFYHNGDLMPYPVYAFGNMYDREQQLKKDVAHIVDTYGQQTYDNAVEVIAKAKPRQLSILNPDINDRPKILAISNFAKQFVVPNLKEDYNLEPYSNNEISTTYYPQKIEDYKTSNFSLQYWFKEWLNYLSNNEKSAFQNCSSWEISNYYLDARSLGRNTSESQKERILQYCPLEGEQLFARFINEALRFEDQQKLDYIWNQMYNGYSSIPYHRIPVGFESSSMFKSAPLQISEIQREGVAFMKASGSGILAFDVGVGKTMTAIVTLANDLYSGKARRPLVVVPNGVYAKWIKEIMGYTDEKTGDFIYGVLSGTDVTINDFYNLGTDALKRLEKEGKVSEKNGILTFKNLALNSITMVTYEGFMKLGFGNDVMDDLFVELSNALSQTDSGTSQRDTEKEMEKYREMIGVGNKGTIVDIDQLGIDYVVIDEAHNFKNVFKYAPTDDEGNKRFKIESSQSSRAIKAYFICNYIQRTYGSNIMLMTATPFTNNPLEVYSMMSLTGHYELQQYGIINLYNFMETFILQSMEYVNNYDGTIIKKPVVKSFNNRLILQKLIFNKINYKTGEEAGVKRPCKINLPRVYTVSENGQQKRLPKKDQLVTYLTMTDEQASNQNYLQNLAQSGTGTERFGNIMRALAGSLDNALSPFIYDKQMPTGGYVEFINKSPKLKYVCECIASVKTYHETKLNETCSGQVVYMNRGKEYFKYIKEFLEKEVGFKAGLKYNKRAIDEIEIITSEVSQADREHIKDAFLDGICKVIIGTATIREGIDLQRRGTVLYDCYPDWNPTDVKQLEGRIWRQGNQFNYVRSVMPLVQDSMDVFVFQKLEEKTARVNDLFFRAERGNVLDVDALDPEDVKFALFTDLDELAKIVIEKQEIDIKRKIAVVDDNLKAINELSYHIKQCNTGREDVKKMLLEAKIALKNFPEYVKMYPTKWDYSEAKLKEYEERSFELVKEIDGWQESTPQDDKVLISLMNRLKASIYRLNNLFMFNEWAFNDFKTSYSIVEKGRKTIMEAKGYSLDSDFETIKEDFNNERKISELALADLHSPENKMAIIKEIQLKKEMNKVEGFEPEVAARDFISLNYLLKYPYDNSTDACELPPPSVEDINDLKATNTQIPSVKPASNGRIFISPQLRELMPKHQQMAMDELRGEGVEELQPVIDAIEEQIKDINKSQDGLGDKAIVKIHYFHGGSDWFVTERSGKREVFGFAILNADYQSAEYGYMSIDEFDSIGMRGGGIQMDFYWTQVTMEQALHDHNPNIYPLDKDDVKTIETKPTILPKTTSLTEIEQLDIFNDVMAAAGEDNFTIREFRDLNITTETKEDIEQIAREIIANRDKHDPTDEDDDDLLEMELELEAEALLLLDLNL